MLWFLLAITISPQQTYTIRQGETAILQLTEEQCQANVFIFSSPPYQCDSDGRLIVGVDFETVPGVYAVGNTGIKIVVQKEKFDKSYRKKGPGRKIDKKAYAAERMRIAIALKSGPLKYPSWPAQIEFQAPLHDIFVTDKFGIQRMYYTKNPKNAKPSPHRGVDLRASYGTPVHAISYGAVVTADTFSEGSEGSMVILYHGSGVYSLYLHLGKFNCIPGQIVNSGDVIAYTGDSGAEGQPHLHFAVKISDAAVDPLKFIETINQYLRQL